MAGKKAPKDRGAEFRDELLKLIPEDKRESVKAALEDEKVLTFAGEHVLRQDESSRLVQTLRETEERQRAWWAEQQGKIAAYDTLITSGKINADGTPKTDDPDDPEPDDDDDPELEPAARRRGRPRKAAPAPAPTPGLTQQEANQMGARLADFNAYLVELGQSHYHTYKEPLRTTELIDFCRKSGVSIDRGGYELFTKELRDKAQATAQAEHDKKIREEERRKTIEEISSKGPGYPIVGSRSSGPDIASLDEVLSPRLAKGKDAPAGDYSAAAAAQAYNQAIFSGGGAQ